MKVGSPAWVDIHACKENRAAYWLRALGRADMPETLCVRGQTWRRTETFKHDFFAATGFYRDESGHRAVLKLGRTEPLAGIPLRWLGRLLTQRELWFYSRLADLPNLPEVIAPIGDTGMLRRLVPGRPIEKGKPIPDGFFAELDRVFNEVHARQVAYVDTNKPQNILLGDDGRPYLIDFQISFAVVGRGNVLSRWLLRRLQREDRYHILKHKRRMRPDELTPDEWKRVDHRSWLIRTHRFLTRPYFLIRRRLYKHLKDTGRLLPSGSE